MRISQSIPIESLRHVYCFLKSFILSKSPSISPSSEDDDEEEDDGSDEDDQQRLL
jgi:hypothetical protein